MSRNINGIPVIEAEPDFICALCGAIAETRPYGPNGEEICFKCGIQSKATTEQMMRIKLFGYEPEQRETNTIQEKKT